MNPSAPNVPASQESPAGVAPEVDVLTSQGARKRQKSGSIRNYDFRQSCFLAPSDLRRIRLRQEQFVRSLAARLAAFLRLEFAVGLNELQIVSYRKFTENLSTPTHISLFKVEPLKGVGLVVVPPRLGLSLADRMLGGPGTMPEAGRDLSQIEAALVNQVATLLVSEWCAHWPEMRDLQPSFLGHEHNSRFLQTAASATPMLALSLTAGVAESSETILLAFPYATVEPLVRTLCPAGPAETNAASSVVARPKWNPGMDDLRVPITAEWRGLKLSAHDITRLKQGHVLMLDPRCTAQVQLRFNQVPKFIGRPGTRAGHWAVELTNPIAI